MQKRISEETHHALTELSTNAGYPITETLSGSGDTGQVLVDAIKNTTWIWSFVVITVISEQANVLRAPTDQHCPRRHADCSAA